MEYIYNHVLKVGVYTRVNTDIFGARWMGWGREIEISVISKNRSTSTIQQLYFVEYSSLHLPNP